MLALQRLSSRILENPDGISALKMREIKLFLASSFRIMFRSPGNTTLISIGRSTKELVTSVCKSSNESPNEFK